MIPDKIEQAIDSAVTSGVTKEELAVIAQIESGFDPKAKAKTSTAKGLFQITGKTRRSLMEGVKKEGKSREQLDSELAAKLTKQHKQALKRKNQDLSLENIYTLHFLGQPEGMRVLESEGSAFIEDVVSEDARRANPGVFENVRTVDDLLRVIAGKVQQARGVLF